MKRTRHNPFINHTAQSATDSSFKQHTPAELLKRIKETCSKQLTVKRLFYGEIPIEQHYVNLSMVGQDKFQNQITNLAQQAKQKAREDLCDIYSEIYGTDKGKIPIEQIVETVQVDEGLASNRILITGTAGIGKSTFSEYLLYLWATEQAPYKKYEWIFRIPLRNLRTEYYLTKTDENYSPIDIIERTCLAPMLNETSESFFQENERIEFTNELSRLVEEDKVLIILDGYDEINAQLPKNLFAALKSLCSISQIIITSRPYNLDSLHNIYGFRADPRKHFEITGFTLDNIKDYVRKFFENLVPLKLEEIESLLNFIESNQNIAGTCRIPINLEFICSTWNSKLISRDICTMSRLYNQVILDLCIRHKEKQTGEKIIDCSGSGLLREYNKHLGLLEYLAYQSILQGKLFLKISETEDYIKEIYPESTDNYITQQKKFGIIKPNTLFGENRGFEEYYFVHLTIRDYFAARYLSYCLQKEVSQIINRKLSSMPHFPHEWQNQETPSVSSFISQKKLNITYEIVMWFIAGILAESNDITTLKYFFYLLITKPCDISSQHIINLLIRALDESQNLYEKLPENLFQQVANWLYLTINPDKPLFLHDSEHHPLWERFKLSQYLFKHPKIQKVFMNGFKNNKTSFENTRSALSAIHQPISDELLFSILETEFLDEMMIIRTSNSFWGRLIEKEKLACIFQESEKLTKKRINALLLLAHLNYFDNLEQAIETFIPKLNNIHETNELRHALTTFLSGILRRALDKWLWDFRRSWNPETIKAFLNHQNITEAFQLFSNLIQNKQNSYELRISAITAFDSAWSSFRLLVDNTADSAKVFLDQSITNIFPFFSILILDKKNPNELRITAITALSNIMCKISGNINSRNLGLESSRLNTILDHEIITKISELFFNLIDKQNSCELHIAIITALSNNLTALISQIWKTALDNSWNPNVLKALLDHQKITEIFQFFIKIILNKQNDITLCIAASAALSKVCCIWNKSWSSGWDRVKSHEMLNEFLEQRNVAEALLYLSKFILDEHSPHELYIASTTVLNNAFELWAWRYYDNNVLMYNWGHNMLNAFLNHPKVINAFQYLSKLILDEQNPNKLRTHAINSLGKILLKKSYNFVLCEKFVVTYFAILTNSNEYNIHHLFTLNLIDAQQEIMVLIKRLNIHLKLIDFISNADSKLVINSSALAILLTKTSNSELINTAISLTNEKSYIRHALFSVLLIRCIESSKVLFFSDQGLNFYEGQTYQTIELTPEQQSIFAHDFEVALKNLTGLSYTYYEKNLLKQLDIMPIKTLDSNNSGENQMKPSSELSSSLKPTNDSWILSIGRKTKAGNIEHAFLIVEGVKNNRRHLWYFDLVQYPDNSGRSMIQQEHHERALDSKERLLTKVTCNDFRKRTEIARRSWNISPDQAESLFQDIEHDYQLEGEDRITYQILGDRSSSAAASSKNGHSCFTWAREKIKNLNDKDVHIPEHWTDFIASLTSFYLDESEENQYSWWKNPKVMVPVAAVAVPIATYGVFHCNIM